MPLITPKKTATAAPAFVWNAFPPPPPEAETWQPDPDSIARPADFPPPRFNRDPKHDRRSKSFNKESKMLATPPPNGQAQIGTRSLPSINGRSLGRELEQSPVPAQPNTGSPPIESVQGHVKTSIAPHKRSKTTTKPVLHVAGPPKGTMELMSAPTHSSPETPVTSTGSAQSASPSKTLPPAWAATLEKALAEDALAAITKVCSLPETIRKKSIPPHLRNKTGDVAEVARLQVSSAKSSASLNPNAKVYEALVKQEDNMKDDALPWEVVTADPETEYTKHGLRMQEEMLKRYIARQPSTTNAATIPTHVTSNTVNVRAPLDHGTKIKVMLIRAMEHEMDLGKVAPERELMAMQCAELDRYYDKVRSAHQQWWKATGKV